MDGLATAISKVVLIAETSTAADARRLQDMIKKQFETGVGKATEIAKLSKRKKELEAEISLKTGDLYAMGRELSKASKDIAAGLDDYTAFVREMAEQLLPQFDDLIFALRKELELETYEDLRLHTAKRLERRAEP